MQFYEKYLKLCHDNNIRPTTAAERMGFKSAHVYRWKNGSVPTDATLLVIAEYFGVTMSDLLPDEEIARRELSQYPPAGMEHVAEEERKKHPEYFGIKKDPSGTDTEEVDEELYDLMTELRDNYALRQLLHAAKGTDAENIKAVAEMLKRFKNK